MSNLLLEFSDCTLSLHYHHAEIVSVFLSVCLTGVIVQGVICTRGSCLGGCFPGGYTLGDQCPGG